MDYSIKANSELFDRWESLSEHIHELGGAVAEDIETNTAGVRDFTAKFVEAHNELKELYSETVAHILNSEGEVEDES